MFVLLFFFNDTATTEIYTLSLHDALPISIASSDCCDWAFQVERIKEKVEEKEGIPPPQQRLIFAGKQMNDDKTAAEYKVIVRIIISEVQEVI